MQNSNSGDLVKFVVGESGENLVYKEFRDNYVCRRSYEKQSAFYQANNSSTIKTPQITSYANLTSFYMERVYGASGADIYTSISTKRLRFHIDQLLFLIENNIRHSDVEKVSSFEITQKISEIERKSKFKEFDIYLKHFSELTVNGLKCHIGQCHGDLTLSNMIMDDESLWLIDFIGAFVDTPYWDIAKLYQEFEFGWSSRFASSESQLRYVLQNRDIKRKIDEFVQEEQLNVFVINCFKYLTLLRIIPYVRDTTTRAWLSRSLLKCAEEFK